MTKLRRLELDAEIQARIADVEKALATYDAGGDSAAVLEIPKLELADAVLRAVAAQRQQRLAKLPDRARVVPVVVDVTIRPKRRRPA